MKKILAFTLTLIMLLSIAAYAEPQSRPNGPYVESEQNISLSGFMSNEQLYEKLQQLEKRSNGKMVLEIAGYSDAIDGDLMEELGYPLYVVKFGDEKDTGKKKVLITSQIHGNEPIGTEAIIDLIQKLLSGGKEANEILDNVTVWFMPRINPDGAMNEVDGKQYPKRQTNQIWDPEYIGLAAGTRAPWYYNSRNQGYDQNRDYNPNLDFRIEDYESEDIMEFLNDRNKNNSNYGGFYVTPEARIVTKVFKELDPDVYFDLHHRGFNTVSDEDNRSVPIQIAAVVADPYTDPFTGANYEVDEDVLELGKQINILGYQSLQKGFSHFGAIQKYPNVNLPGTSLGAFALNDTSIMLIEVKGQTHNLGQKQSGMLTQTVIVPVYEILKGLSDGSVYDIDPALYDEIPESANSIRDPS